MSEAFFAQSKAIDQDASFQAAKPEASGYGKYSLACGIYLVAIAVATIGWLWLIAWMALRLMQSVAGSWL